MSPDGVGRAIKEGEGGCGQGGPFKGAFEPRGWPSPGGGRTKGALAKVATTAGGRQDRLEALEPGPETLGADSGREPQEAYSGWIGGGGFEKARSKGALGRRQGGSLAAFAAGPPLAGESLGRHLEAALGWRSWGSFLGGS
jgi:hypothetical protein